MTAEYSVKCINEYLQCNTWENKKKLSFIITYGSIHLMNTQTHTRRGASTQPQPAATFHTNIGYNRASWHQAHLLNATLKSKPVKPHLASMKSYQLNVSLSLSPLMLAHCTPFLSPQQIRWNSSRIAYCTCYWLKYCVSNALNRYIVFVCFLVFLDLACCNTNSLLWD